MVMKKIHFFILTFILFSPMYILAQADIHFSQFYETSLLRNPALAGVFSNNYKISVYYRDQWNTITNPYQTILINGEYRFSLGKYSNDYLSIGLLGYNDEAGDLSQKISAFYGAINYNKSINEDYNSYLSFGFAGGYMQYSFDPSKATFNNQFINGFFDPNNPSLENLPVPKMSLYDLGAGANYNFSLGESQESTFMFGVSGYHFTQPIFSYDRSYTYTQNIRFNVNASMVTQLNENIVLQLHANYAKQGSYDELIGGALIGWQSYEVLEEPTFQFYAGLLYRYQDAIIPIIKLKHDHLGIGLSYDVNTSTLKKASNAQGGFEITAFITGNYPPGRGTTRKTVCPRFN